MREIRGHRPGVEVDFIPKSFGNKADPTPVTIRYRVPNEMERRKLVVVGDSLEVILGDDGEPERIVTKSDAHIDRQVNALAEQVTSVANYTGRDGPITNGEQLGRHGDGKIVDEVFDEIMGTATLTENELEKSDGSSDSQDLAIQDSGETAQSAENGNSTDQETATGEATQTMNT